MISRRGVVASLAVLATSWTAAPASADCVPSVAAAEIRVERCLPILEFARERTAESLLWVQTYIEVNLRNYARVVVIGHVSRVRSIEPEILGAPAPPATEEVSTEGAWILSMTESCEGVRPGEIAYFRMTSSCCDTYPPESEPCLLELGVLQPLPAEERTWFPERAPKDQG